MRALLTSIYISFGIGMTMILLGLIVNGPNESLMELHPTIKIGTYISTLGFVIMAWAVLCRNVGIKLRIAALVTMIGLEMMAYSFLIYGGISNIEGCISMCCFVMSFSLAVLKD